MVFLPEAGVYVAVGVPFDVFFAGGRYYYYSGGHWFWSPYYDGPWVIATTTILPPGLASHPIVHLGSFRERVKFFVPQGKGNKHKNKHDD